MGLVQPASAALYDYYNPGEHAGALGRLGVGAHVGHRGPGQGAVAGESCGPQDGTQTGALALTPLCFSQSTSVLCFTEHQLRANSCPPCVLPMSASVLRVRPGPGGRGRGHGRDLPVSPGPLTSGKCPRQRRALERGLVEEDGYRMKFACYYPRVEYGQSSCPACARPP